MKKKHKPTFIPLTPVSLTELGDILGDVEESIAWVDSILREATNARQYLRDTHKRILPLYRRERKRDKEMKKQNALLKSGALKFRKERRKAVGKGGYDFQLGHGDV